jgi:heat shock protein HslJ
MADVLDGTAWMLQDGDVSVTAEFAAGRISGRAGCNHYGGGYRVEGTRFALDAALVTTLMMCPDDVMRVEQRVLAALGAATSFVHTDEELLLFDAAGEEVLRLRAAGPDDLHGTWVVGAIHWPQRQAIVSVDGELTLTISARGVTGHGGCNSYRGPVRVAGRSLEVGPLVSTRMACAPEVMAQEHALLAALEASATYRAEGEVLHLLRSDGGISVTLRRPVRP